MPFPDSVAFLPFSIGKIVYIPTKTLKLAYFSKIQVFNTLCTMQVKRVLGIYANMQVLVGIYVIAL